MFMGGEEFWKFDGVANGSSGSLFVMPFYHFALLNCFFKLIQAVYEAHEEFSAMTMKRQRSITEHILDFVSDYFKIYLFVFFPEKLAVQYKLISDCRRSTNAVVSNTCLGVVHGKGYARYSQGSRICKTCTWLSSTTFHWSASANKGM